MNYKLFTDGGARGNPGPAAGAILFDEDDHLIWFDSRYLGKTTNNKAEYQAVLLGMKNFQKAIASGDNDTNTKLTCYLDSELIVKQFNGEYKIKDQSLKSIYENVKKYIAGFEVEFIHVYREKNKFADKLVNISLDAANEKSED